MRTVVLLALLSLFVAVVNTAVISIDFGTDTFKIGIAKSGAPIDLVLNEQSKRKTTNMVGFRGENERYLGENALQQSPRFPDMMFKHLDLLLAEKADSPSVERLKAIYMPMKVEANERGGVNVVSRDGKSKYCVEELLGMIFKYIKELGKESARSVVNDVVITVPSWYSLQKRQAILDAASIAELKVLTLLHENTAAAIQYGISKHKTMKDTIKTSDHILALLDFGHSHLTASVYNYTFGTSSLGQLELVQMEYDSQLGGLDLDIALAEHFADHFEKQYKLNVRKEPRAMNRLIQQARKTKEILSANAETYAQVESLMDDRDFRLLMSREKLQELVAPVAERIKKVVTKALANVERIDAVELIGGANRVPFVQQIIKEAVGGVNLGFSLNADEAISLGAAFHAASLGSSFRVKKYDIVDRHYGVQFKVGEEEPQVFEKIARRVSTNMTIEQDFVVGVTYNTLPPNVKQAEISKYEISNVTETMAAWPKEQGKHKRVTLSLGLNRSGAPTCEASAVLEETITVRVPKPQKVENDTTTETKEEKTEEEKFTYEKRKKYTTVPLVVKEVSALEPKPLTTGEREEARKRRVRIEQFERLKRDIAGLRNKIESAVYDVRSNLLEEEQYKPYYKKEDKTGLEKFADEIDEWLSGESDDVTSEKYTSFSDKHQALKNLVDPIYERYQETSRREKVVDNCEKVFNQTRSMLEQITRNSPWVPELDVNEVLQQVRDVEAWVRETLAKQGRTPLSETPVALSEEYKEKCAKPLTNAIKLFKTPKPKVETIKVNETTTAEPKNEETAEKAAEQPKDEL